MVEIPEVKWIIQADQQLMSRAITNLLTNAIKYNQTGHNIWITVEQKDCVVVSVMEDGTLISQELSGQLFEPFVRGDASRSSTGGTGLGLSITKAIVEKHGGRVEYLVVSGHNCFRIKLPMCGVLNEVAEGRQLKK